MNLIPETGWKPMVDATDTIEPVVVRYHEHNKPSGPWRVQLAQYLPNDYGEFAWRPAWKTNGGTVYAAGFMSLEQYHAAAKELFAAQTPEFDL